MREETGSQGGSTAADRVQTPAARDPLLLRPVRGGNGFEEALEQILQVVRLGLVPAGRRLPPERELAVRLGVSRATLREVLRVLHAEGLVRSRRGRYGGTFVQPRPSASQEAAGRARLRRRVEGVDLADVLDFREVLEVGAARLCARRQRSEGHDGRLRAALEATGDAPLPEYRRQDTLLHLTIAELSGSPTLAARYAAVRATVNELLDCIPLLVRGLEHAQRQHEALVAALLAGDERAAGETMREHCAGTAALLRGFLS